MENRPVRRIAHSVLLIFLFVLMFFVSIPPNSASAHDALAPNALPRSQTDISGPAGSSEFGTRVVVLPNGNFVVVDPTFSEGGLINTGAVYLYSGATRTIISTLKGTRSWDYVGSEGVTVLTNGNFVVVNPGWDDPIGSKVEVGAVTWCSATTGCNGVITAANSLIGGTAYDELGFSSSGGVRGGVTALTNGNYVVRSPEWDNPDGSKVNAGAVTWCSGTSGCKGVVSAANSLIGGSTWDSLGLGGVTALTNGNYVVRSPIWDNPAGLLANVGAVTWCSGASGCKGPVTATNSLIGGTANDQVGETAVTALTNGNYVVASPNWDNSVASTVNVGAVTWGNGTSGTVGVVSGANSLIGYTAGDQVGNVSAVALTNGNYVVASPKWDNPNGSKVNAGAVTWCSGTSGCTGVVSAATALVGSTLNDAVGSAVIPLKNGNYVVASLGWDNSVASKVDVGAATWCSGTGGCSGLVTTANSLTGNTANDQVGYSVTALTDGSYVVQSPLWNNPAVPTADVGAATWCSGTTGCQGTPSAANSLIGGTPSDQIGSAVVALTNGNYVVQSSAWDNPGLIADVGAATWCSGTSGCSGLVTTANSLVGGIAGDQVGGGYVTALTNGNYVVQSPYWNNPEGPFVDAGAVTWCNGASGCSGLVTTANSLVGGTLNDFIGLYVTALPNGSYVVRSPIWDNPDGAIVDAGAVTWGNGTGGTTGLVTSANSVLGTVTDGISEFSYDATRNRLFVGRGPSNTVSILYFSNADLQNLALSSGTLSPTFAAATTSYTAQVPSSVASLTVTPTAADPTAIITVNGAAVTSGSASGPINLNVGTNLLTVVVTAAQDGTTTRTYTISVTRANPSLCLPLIVR